MTGVQTCAIPISLVTYIGEARGEEVDVKHLTEMTEAIAFSLKRQYLGELPKKEPLVKNRDLEDLIQEIKSHPDYEKQKKSWELGKQKLNQDDFIIKDTKDGRE